MKRLLIGTMSVMVIFAFLPGPAIAARKAKWKFTNIQPAGQVYTQYFNQLCANIAKATNGEVEVTNFPDQEHPL